MKIIVYKWVIVAWPHLLLPLSLTSQEVAKRSVTRTQVEVENGGEEKEAVQTVSSAASTPVCVS